MPQAERVLFVHAHPDDESIATGGTIATLVEAGAQVTVLTCTRGERGEVIPPELAHLEGSPQLAEHREAELREALKALGVHDHRYLGEPGARWPGRAIRRYVDSGMAWGEHGAEELGEYDPASLTAAEFGEVAADVASVILDIDADAVISYDERGGYGHPDHIRAHEAARRAAEVYGRPFYAVEPEGSAHTPTVQVDVRPVLERKRAALSAHRSQLTLDGDGFVLSNGVRHPIGEVESFRRFPREEVAEVTPLAEQHWVIKLVAAAVSLVVGLSVGAMLTVLHQGSIAVAGMQVPVGLIAGIALVAALLLGLRLVFSTRLVSGFAAVGILFSVGMLSLESAGGSVLVPANEAGYVWAYAPAVVAVLVLAWPKLPPRSRDTMGRSAK